VRWKIPECLLPHKAVERLIACGAFSSTAYDEGWLHFRNEESGLLFSIRTVTGEFPDLRALFVGEAQHKIHFPSQQISEAIDRVKIFSRRDFFVDEQMEVRAEAGGLQLSAQGQDMGWVQEWVPMDDDQGLPPGTAFSIHPQFLQDILSEESTVAHVHAGRLMFEGDSWQHVVSLQNADAE
jgi:DNA polymerase III sliding clamp (beta) subunit (PCNA family)